jgi:hypothetical protein
VGVDIGVGVDVGADFGVDTGLGADADINVDAGVWVGREASRPVELSFDPINHTNPTISISTKTTRGTLSVSDFGIAESWL